MHAAACECLQVCLDASAAAQPPLDPPATRPGATGFGTPSAEGTITASRLFAAEYIAPTNQFSYEWPLAHEPGLLAANYLRIRVDMEADVNMVCWVRLKF